jgi:hypothetical protein
MLDLRKTLLGNNTLSKEDTILPKHAKKPRGQSAKHTDTPSPAHVPVSSAPTTPSHSGTPSPPERRSTRMRQRPARLQDYF